MPITLLHCIALFIFTLITSRNFKYTKRPFVFLLKYTVLFPDSVLNIACYNFIHKFTYFFFIYVSDFTMILIKVFPLKKKIQNGYHTRVTPLVDGMSSHFVDFICLFLLFESLFVLLFRFVLFPFFPSSFCFRGQLIFNPYRVLQVPYGYSNYSSISCL